VAASAFVGFGALLVLAFPLSRYLVDYRYTPERPWPHTAEGRRAIGQMLLAIPAYYGQLLFPPGDLPTLELDIRFRHLEKLAKKRREALERGILFASDRDFVPAVMRAQGHALRVKVRLKGDLADHFWSDRWSLRVHVRDGQSAFGMRRFSLQSPHTRGFQREPLFLEYLRERRVLAPRSRFVRLVINGDDNGLFALEEHFAKELLEAQGRREGVILKFDESEFWRAAHRLGRRHPDFANWRNARIGVFQAARIARSPALAHQLEIGAGLLRSLALDRLAPRDVLDLESWATYLAGCEIFYASHSSLFQNLRFYLDPLSLRIEPLVFDVGVSDPAPPPARWRCQGGLSALTTAWLQDEDLARALPPELERQLRWVASGGLRAWLREREPAHLEVLRREFPWVEPMPVDRFEARARSLLEQRDSWRGDALRPPPPADGAPPAGSRAYPTLVMASLLEERGRPVLELSNATSRPVLVTALDVPAVLPIALPPTPWPDPPKPARVLVDPGSRRPLRGMARFVDDGEFELPFTARRAAPPLAAHPLSPPSLDETLDAHRFLRRDGSRPDLVVVRPGTHDVAGWIELPPGVDLRLRARTRLRFAPQAGLIVRGALEALGDPASPVTFEAQKPEAGWLGIVVFGTERPSRLEHAVIRDTNGVARGGWSLTGAVTFHRAQVGLSHVRFAGSRAEDALNLVQSRFSLDDVDFGRAASDAIDVDFGEGTLRDARFVEIGGDAVDVSGTRANLERIAVLRAGDKALSVGERSRVFARALQVRESRIGAASKDGSELEIEGASFRDTGLAALLAYQKKPEYGPGTLRASGVEFQGGSPAVRAQTGSRIELEGRSIETEPLDVDALYATEGDRK
jgi:hypothetical protein